MIALVFLEVTDARRKIHIDVYNTHKAIIVIKQKMCIHSGYTLILS